MKYLHVLSAISEQLRCEKYAAMRCLAKKGKRFLAERHSKGFDIAERLLFNYRIAFAQIDSSERNDIGTTHKAIRNDSKKLRDEIRWMQVERMDPPLIFSVLGGKRLGGFISDRVSARSIRGVKSLREGFVRTQESIPPELCQSTSTVTHLKKLFYSVFHSDGCMSAYVKFDKYWEDVSQSTISEVCRCRDCIEAKLAKVQPYLPLNGYDGPSLYDSPNNRLSACHCVAAFLDELRAFGEDDGGEEFQSLIRDKWPEFSMCISSAISEVILAMHEQVLVCITLGIPGSRRSVPQRTCD